MHLSTSKAHTRRAGSLVRTFVVGSATLAILLVCFAMYQYTQVDATQAPAANRARLPSLASKAEAPASVPDVTSATGVPIEGGVLGPGRDVKLTIYAPEGTRARFDIEVEDWTPRPGAIDEFILVRPRVRMRTRSGNAVRITADEGVIEAQRQGGGSIDPRRGRLTGNVVIEYDRLTERDRSERAAPETDEIDPAELVRMEMPEIEFDLEYAKVTVPGRIQVTAADAEFAADGVEIRFNDAENRVESLRIANGGRIVLKGNTSPGGAAMPGMGSAPSRQVTLSHWLRETLQSRLSLQNGGSKTTGIVEAVNPTSGTAARDAVRHDDENTQDGNDTATPPAVTRRDDGAFVFRSAGDQRRQDDASVRYFARFEQDIDVTRSTGGEVATRLQADWLEVLRDVSRQDATGAQSSKQPVASQKGTGSLSTVDGGSTDEIVVAWGGRLAVEAVDEASDHWKRDPRTRVSAGGTPVRVAHSDGGATCDELTYYPGETEITLRGTDEHPVRVRSLRDGSLTGMALATQRNGDAFSMSITGPGTVERPDETALSASPGAATKSTGSANALHISFDELLTAKGRFVSEKSLDVAGLSVSETQKQVVDEATLTGAVRLVQRDVNMEADSLTVNFTNRAGWWRSESRALERVRGVGHVSMTQDNDRITCDELDVAMTEDLTGGARPREATARGNVHAMQGERSIRATESLVVEFGVDESVSAVDDDLNESASNNKLNETVARSSRVTPRSLRAVGDVVVTDPAQRLDLRANALDCAFMDSGAIETATVTGQPQKPASVRLDDLGVVGEKILLNMRDESADVPGNGRLTIQSTKDLDGRTVKDPIAIAVTWTESLSYRGKENRAVFDGAVHATSETSVTFDCDRLLVDFDNITRVPIAAETPTPSWYAWQADPNAADPWWRRSAGVPVTLVAGASSNAVATALVTDAIVESVVHQWRPRRNAADGSERLARAAKEPAYLLATGSAVALITNVNAATGDIESRARINGPTLSLNLRRDASKMLIEGPGSLLLEDYRTTERAGGSPASNPTAVSTTVPAAPRRGLLTTGGDGPSSTLIEWRNSMWYDFSIEQTRFEGDVELKYLSGAALQRVLNPAAVVESGGRSTFLSCDLLTVDFLDRSERRRSASAPRMGQLSAASLRQFDARGDVRLQDVTERLNLQADQVIYERPRDILIIHGSPQRKARIVRHEPNKLPTQVQVLRMIYDLSTGKFNIDDPELTGQ